MEQTQKQSLLLIQNSITSKLIKSKFPQKIVTSDFKKEFNKALSIFILFLQNTQTKKRYTRDDVINALQQEGFGGVAEKVRDYNLSQNQNQDNVSRKKAIDLQHD